MVERISRSESSRGRTRAEASLAASRGTRGGSRAGRGRREPTARSAEVNWRLIWAAISIVLLVLGVVAELAVLLPSGAIGEPTRKLVAQAVGWTAPLLPLWLIGLGGLGLVKVARPELEMPVARLWGLLLVYLALVGLFHVIPIGGPGGLALAQEGNGGGLVGFALGTGLSEALGPGAAVVLLVSGLVLGAMMAARVTISQASHWLLALVIAGSRAGLQRYRRERALRVNSPEPVAERALPVRIANLVRRPARPRPPAETPPEPAPSLTAAPRPAGQESWRVPPMSVYETGGTPEVTELDVRVRARIIEETLASFNIEAKVVEANQGPAVTQFGIEPAAGVAVRRILALQNDLGLRLGAWPVRFEAPVPGKRMVGLEVPNQSVAVVGLRGLLESDDAARIRSRIKLALGRDVSGKAVVVDLARMPHLLIAGATGSGKSVCINAILACLLSQNTPDDLQLMMIDPKMVELMPYNGIPHLRMPVVTDMDQVVGTLKWVVREMERRYALFVQVAVRNIESYNRFIEQRQDTKPLPYLVVVIDELADMMMTAPDEVEIALCRLAQKARATGIHLIVATQRPSVDVLTGMIKANFVTRIAFAVSSQIDSRVILDTPGAEKLLGRGDMLYSSGDTSKPKRIQGAWVSDHELGKLVTHWKRQGLPRYTEADIQEVQALGQSEEQEEEDELYDRAVGLTAQYSRLSTSLLQRRLGIGYPRAARLMDLMQDRGVITTSEDGRSREVVARAEAPDEE